MEALDDSLFFGKRRIFLPEEIIDFNLPMTPHIAYIQSWEKIYQIIDRYFKEIICIYLSGKRNQLRHCPIDEKCIELVKYLNNKEWQGNIILNYVPKYHKQQIEDLEKLRIIIY